MTRRIDPFDGPGEVRSIARSIDWAATPLGAVETWSPTLRHVVRTILDSPFPINLWCGPDRVLIYNDAYRSVLGAKHPAALGRPGAEVWSEIWHQIEPMFARIRDGGDSVYAEDAPFVVRRAQTEPAAESEPNAWFTFSLSAVRDESDEIIAFLNIVSESTRRVEAERAHEAARAKAERAESRLRDVFAQAPAFMAVLRGEDHVFEYANRAYYQLVGHRDLLGRSVWDALPEMRGQGFEDLLTQVLETGEPFIGREIPVMIARTPDSPLEERFVDLVYYPITEVDGRRTGVVAHGSDVTEHVLARQEAQRARAAAERANQAKSQFLATMSHEIRTPINAVVGYADLLDAGVGGELSDQQHGYVEGIRASSRHLLGLVSDILDLAKIESGEMRVQVDEITAHGAVDAATRLIAPQAARKDLELVEKWDCEKTEPVRGDEDRVRQILLNLLSNALKFTDAGGRVTVRCRITDSAPADAALPGLGPWLVIEVEDTGRGIAQEQLGRVFEPFIQVEEGHTRRAGGTGLGLTISRRLARLMGGELTVESEPGRGSTFSLWLAPAVQGRIEDPADRPPAIDAWPPEPHELPGLASAGRALLAVLEDIEEEWVARLRADPLMNVAERANRAQLGDQTAELVAAIAKTLFVLEEGEGDPQLLRDAQAVHGLVARRHGSQRRRLGWSRAELEREHRLLAEVLDAALRREAPKRTAASLGTALAIVHRLVGRAARSSRAGFEGAEEPLEEEAADSDLASIAGEGSTAL